MKKDHYPSSIFAIISLLGGIACFILFWFGPMDWLDTIIYAYLFFFGLAVLLGTYSLLIKRTARAWTAVVVGLIFIVLFLISVHLMSEICVIC